MLSKSKQITRRGFTIIELLVVIGLIAFLVSVLTVALGNALSSARQRATQATLIKIDGLLQQRLDAFNTNLDRTAKRGEVAIAAKALQTYLNQNGLPGLLDPVCELLARKNRFRQAFPQTGQTGSPAGVDAPSLVAAGQPFNGNAQNEAESSEYLYYMLKQSDFFGVPPVGDSDFSASETADTDGDGRQEFVDAWKRPFRFYRWPTRLLKVNGASSSLDRLTAGLLIKGLPAPPTQPGDADPLSQDGDDRLGLFAKQQSPGGQTPAQYAANFEQFWHTLQTYHVPLVVSAGQDGSLGLFEPYQISTSQFGYLAQPRTDLAAAITRSHLTDNITNCNAKSR